MRSTPRWQRRGLTLIEILICMAIIALVISAVVVGSGRTGSAKLRHSSTMIVGAVRVAFSHASASSKSVRLVMDFKENEIWLEEGDQPMLVQSKDKTGTGGAAAATVAERTALEETSRIVKGPTPPRTSYTEIDPMGVVASAPGKGHKPLEDGIKILSVQTQHDDVPRTDGRAYLYFWPGGQTERAVITLTIGDSRSEKEPNKEKDEANAITLVVSPLTGKVTVKDGVVPLTTPETDKDNSDREDPGAF